MYIAFAFKGNKKYWFTGNGFDTVKRKARQYKTTAGLGAAVGRFAKLLPEGYGVKAEEVKPAKKTTRKKTTRKTTRRKKNPVPLSRAAKIEMAMKRYREFSGHDPKFIDEYDKPKLDVAFKVGMCDGILYTTVRDGRTEKYIHRFKKRARPILASNYDGSEIGLIAGDYSFTERGIVDN